MHLNIIVNQNDTLKVKYYYDGLNRLVREDNVWQNKTICYAYDAGGIRTSKTIPWAWTSLVGDVVDLVPFVTGVGEVTKTVKIVIKSLDGADDVIDTAKYIHRTAGKTSGVRKLVGSYEITYSSGFNYVGKGKMKRAINSAKRYVKNDTVTGIMWKSALNDREAFIDEFLMQKKRGVTKRNKEVMTYNRIWSPGKRYYEQNALKKAKKKGKR